MSCRDGYTNSYVVLMWYVVLIKVIFVIGGCVVLCLGILLVLYSNVCGKILVCKFIFLVRGLLCWENAVIK